MLRWPSLSCQSIAPSSKEFAMCVVSLRTFTLRRYKFLSLHARATTTPRASLTLQPSLSNSTLKPSEMSLLTEMRLFFIFGTSRTWVMVVCVNWPPTYIMALMSPLANGLQNSVIAYEHLPWGNALLCGKPFLFKCHVLRSTGIDNPIIRGMIIGTQCRNKHLLMIFTSLISFFFFIIFLL